MYDDKVLKNTLFAKDFKISNKNYYLANARYYNTDYFLCPYYSICYYLKKQAVMGKKLVNKEELFNFCHLSLCNVVERIFGVIKRCF